MRVKRVMILGSSYSPNKKVDSLTTKVLETPWKPMQVQTCRQDFNHGGSHCHRRG